MKYRTVDDVVLMVATRLRELADNPIQVGVLTADLGVVGARRWVLVRTPEGLHRAPYGLVLTPVVGGTLLVGRADGRLDAPWVVWWSAYQLGPLWLSSGSGVGGVGTPVATEDQLAVDPSGTGYGFAGGLPMGLGVGVLV